MKSSTYIFTTRLFHFLAVSTLLFSTVVFAEDPTELHFIFQKQKDPNQIRQAADEVAKYLSARIGMPVRAKVPTDYAASVQAMVSKQADFAYTSALPFLLARRDGGAELLLVEERVDSKGTARTEYDSVFVVLKDSPLTSVEQIIKGSKNIRITFTSPTSTSGYIFPYLRFVKAGLLAPKQDPKSVFKQVSFGGGYTEAVEEVLAGRSDVCAVSYYVVEGESSKTYLTPEKLAKIRVLDRTPGVPTHLVSARAGLSKELKNKVSQALIELGKEKPELLKDVYGTATFVKTDADAHLAAAIEAVTATGLPIEGLAK